MRPFVNSEIVSGPAERASNWREGIGVPYTPGTEAYGWERGIADDNRWLSVARQEIASAKQYMNRTQFNPLTGRNERVNPYAKKSFRKTHGGGLGSLISGGGIFGNLK